LGRVAEIVLAFGTTAAIALDDEPSLDTVWLDVTGAAHLTGGEEALLELLAEPIAALGHRVRLAVADGPRLAPAAARWAAPGKALQIVPVGHGRRAMEPLPIRALPIDGDIATFLVRVGVMTVGDLVALPREAAHARLGRRATVALDLALGRDIA